MFVKICGTTNLADAALAVELGADALGFIFAPSKRRVGVREAAAIASELPEHVQRVGVFTEPLIYELQEAVREVGLTGIQMHWPAHEGTTEIVHGAFGGNVALWQVLSYDVEQDSAAADEAFLKRVAHVLGDERLAGVLLDTQTARGSGGTGVALPWPRIARLMRAAEQARAAKVGTEARILLAGGLDAENVGEAIRTLRPWGVDVVSGVEAEPGRKDAERLRAFVRNAKAG